MFEKVSPVEFRRAFNDARLYSATIAEYTSPWADLPGESFLSSDGQSGFVIRPGGEVCLLFSLVRGRGDALVEAAVAAGGTHLDCFDGYLPGLYARHGFVEVAREANWPPGDPDVVFMRLAVDHA